MLKDILQSKDRDDKGYVDIDELGDCLEAFGFSPDDDDLQFLKKHMDDNGKQHVFHSKQSVNRIHDIALLSSFTTILWKVVLL